jgi:hypothetical protein
VRIDLRAQRQLGFPRQQVHFEGARFRGADASKASIRYEGSSPARRAARRRQRVATARRRRAGVPSGRCSASRGSPPIPGRA